MKWFRVYTDLIDDPRIGKLNDANFRRQIEAAIRGDHNDISNYIAPDNGRLSKALWTILRSKIFKRDNYTCSYCGKWGVSLECDHVIPISRGGSDEEENLTTACFKCNRSKRSKTPQEWIYE